MQRALELARRGLGRVEPNPMVGCVLAKGSRIISEGYHRRFGGPHAEVRAIRACSRSTRGATVYVTLEPCAR
ncbi:MAG: bifunctional diaminohydroxyphosphoribosylaminopyrimidine deaminase/5-amino-6-(5-phosphoribosylamino)uracil reductase, partial [Planctomycetes bacterium]|nr:bifunctional diaminohydroxyphosphoribosylaminopyrimidine deaminase/5-amino-6-(5-phosphoribosylamino)uracil reductase [Planctomycetota bacterium]